MMFITSHAVRPSLNSKYVRLSGRELWHIYCLIYYMRPCEFTFGQLLMHASCLVVLGTGPLVPYDTSIVSTVGFFLPVSVSGTQ